jgi:adenosylcobinamide-GDP ribazoletransferase
MRGAFAFLTTLGGAERPAPGSLRWFPVVGLVVGGALGATWWGAVELWPPLLAAVLVVIVELALTGLLHVDGLADTADGLLPPLERERRLAVMAEPDVGAFGVAAVAATLLLRFALLASIETDVLLVATVWAACRGAAAMALLSMPYARPGGLATAFRGRSPLAVVAAVLAYAAVSVVDVVAVVGVAAGFLVVVLLAVRRIGGYTGDVLGAAIVTGETLGLLAAAA